jgi:hypothetical protein
MKLIGAHSMSMVRRSMFLGVRKRLPYQKKHTQ